MKSGVWFSAEFGSEEITGLAVSAAPLLGVPFATAEVAAFEGFLAVLGVAATLIIGDRVPVYYENHPPY